MARLIVGLGNPGKAYEKTRHNVGFLAVRALADAHGFPWKEDKRFLGKVAKGIITGETVVLLQPHTYMNESGRAVRKVMDYYKVDVDACAVIVDDVA